MNLTAAISVAWCEKALRNKCKWNAALCWLAYHLSHPSCACPRSSTAQASWRWRSFRGPRAWPYASRCHPCWWNCSCNSDTPDNSTKLYSSVGLTPSWKPWSHWMLHVKLCSTIHRIVQSFAAGFYLLMEEFWFFVRVQSVFGCFSCMGREKDILILFWLNFFE